jgi:hypothetical protein
LNSPFPQKVARRLIDPVLIGLRHETIRDGSQQKPPKLCRLMARLTFVIRILRGGGIFVAAAVPDADFGLAMVC